MKFQKNITYKVNVEFENDTYFFIEMTEDGGAYFHRMVDGKEEDSNWSYFTKAEVEEEGLIVPAYTQEECNMSKLQTLINEATAIAKLMDETEFNDPMYLKRAELEQEAFDKLTAYCFSIMPVKWQKEVYNSNYPLWRAKVLDKYIFSVPNP